MDIVISAVTASSVLDVARTAAPHLKPGQVFFDVNSASPETKRTAAGIVEASGAHYVEGAVMAPVPARASMSPSSPADRRRKRRPMRSTPSA